MGNTCTTAQIVAAEVLRRLREYPECYDSTDVVGKVFSGTMFYDPIQTRPVFLPSDPSEWDKGITMNVCGHIVHSYLPEAAVYNKGFISRWGETDDPDDLEHVNDIVNELFIGTGGDFEPFLDHGWIWSFSYERPYSDIISTLESIARLP